MSQEYIDRQPYLAEIVDQGLSEMKDGNILFKLFFKLLGKVKDPGNPEAELEPLARYEEHEIRFGFTGTPEILEWRMRDLSNLGFTGDDLSVLDTRHKEAQSFIGKKVLVSPNIKSQGGDEPTKIYWNLMQAKKRFVRDVDLKKASSKLSKISEQIKKAKEKAAGVKEETPF